MMSQPLNENDREALSIRWRNISRLALLDHFTGSQNYNRLIIKEALDLTEGVIRSFAAANGICSSPFPRLLEGTLACFSAELSARISDINTTLVPLRDVFRNPEAHELSLPMPPLDTVRRVLKRLKEWLSILDPDFVTYAKREQRELLRLGCFYYQVVMEGNVPYNLIAGLKQEEKVKQMGKREIRWYEERSPDMIISLIENGSMDAPDYQFEEQAQNWL